jgi:hypothetical protein
VHGGLLKHSERTVATLRQCADDLEVVLRALPPVTPHWQSHDTAPKEQRVLVVLKPQPLEREGEITFGCLVPVDGEPADIWTRDETGEAIMVTHWMPLPRPPVPGQEPPHKLDALGYPVDGSTYAEESTKHITAAPAPSPAALEDWLDGREFYEVMQAYRHTSLTTPLTVIEAFVAVKRAILRASSALSASPPELKHEEDNPLPQP